MVLLSSNFIPEEDETEHLAQERPKEFELNYVGCSNYRYYIISNIILKETLFVTGRNQKVEVDQIYKGES